MLLPRFTIRTLLAMLTICACGFVVVGTAYRGQYWAWGVTFALVTLIATALVHAAWFGAVWIFSQMSSPHGGRAVAPAVQGLPAVSGEAGAVQQESSVIDQPSAT